MTTDWAYKQEELDNQRYDWEAAKEASDYDDLKDGLLGDLEYRITELIGHNRWQKPHWYIRKYQLSPQAISKINHCVQKRLNARS